MNSPFPQVIFKHIDSEFIRKCFLEALDGFPELANRKLVLQMKKLTTTTMQAQPIFDTSAFNKNTRGYRIVINNRMTTRNNIKIEDLPFKVLVGWFAHELGHVMDYLDRSLLSMMKFGAMYVLSKNHRIGTERIADLIAIEKGFAPFLIETKKYILEQSALPDIYKNRITQYYMSPDEVALLAKAHTEKAIRQDEISLFG